MKDYVFHREIRILFALGIFWNTNIEFRNVFIEVACCKDGFVFALCAFHEPREKLFLPLPPYFRCFGSAALALPVIYKNRESPVSFCYGKLHDRAHRRLAVSCSDIKRVDGNIFQWIAGYDSAANGASFCGGKKSVGVEP